MASVCLILLSMFERLCKNCVRARACVYYTCHHGRMVVTSTCSSWGNMPQIFPWPLSSPWQQDQGWGTGLCWNSFPWVPKLESTSSSSVAILPTAQSKIFHNVFSLAHSRWVIKPSTSRPWSFLQRPWFYSSRMTSFCFHFLFLGSSLSHFS